ncbi:MAG: hypothetical protein WHV66_14220 [Anaerolineales bacterium]
MRRFIVLSLLLVILAACSGQGEVEVLPTDTPSPSATPTATIQWFPPTDTPRPLATPTTQPTPDLRPGIGKLILEDDFEQNSPWQTQRSAAGSVAFGKQELTLAIAQPQGALFSFRREPALDNFYMEITASPSLCRGADVYGLLLRAASPQDTYRFLIACNGMLRLERIKNSKVVILYDWTPSAQVPPGSPLVLRVGVWMLNNEMRFFINDVYQFGIHDTVWQRGSIGVFARSAGKNALTINFSNLAIYALDAQRISPLEATASAATPTAVLPWLVTRTPTFPPLTP